MLPLAMLGLFLGMPADSGGIEKDFRATQGREPGRLRVPLIPADAYADPGEFRLPGREAEIPRREIKLLVKEGVVRDVHLAVLSEIASIGVNDGGGIVVNPRGTSLEK